jgi:hypothetical protein
MLKQLHKALTHKEEYFQLAISTECDIKLPLLDDVVIYFSATWSNDDKWRFWMDYRGLITLIGTIEQIKDENAYENENIPEACLIKITSNIGLISKILATLLPELLYDHIILWEEKSNFDNDASIVEIGPNHRVSLHEAKQKLASHYQLMKDFLEYINLSADKTTSKHMTLLQYNVPSGANGSLALDRDRKSFITKMNDNCVEETETAILNVILAKVDGQRFLTIGQLRLLQFLKNHSDS